MMHHTLPFAPAESESHLAWPEHQVEFRDPHFVLRFL